MNSKERNINYMLENVSKVLSEHKEVWENEDRMVLLMENFNRQKDQLSQLFIEKQELNIPYAEVKAQLMDEFAGNIAKLAGFLHDICTEKGIKNMTLYTDVTRASLINGSIQQMLTKSEAVIQYAQQMEEDLKSFSNGEALLAESIEQFKTYNQNGLLPYDRRNRLRSVNLEIKDLLSRLRDFLSDRLDRVVLFFENEHPIFYKNYQNARVVPKISGGIRSNGEGSSPIEDRGGGLPPVETEDSSIPETVVEETGTDDEVSPGESPSEPPESESPSSDPSLPSTDDDLWNEEVS